MKREPPLENAGYGPVTNVFQADNIKNTSPKCHFTYFFSLWALPMILLTAGALIDPQLPARPSNVYTTDARLGGIGRVASTGWHRPGAPQTKILATPVSMIRHSPFDAMDCFRSHRQHSTRTFDTSTMSDSTSEEVVLNMTTTANDAAIGVVGDEVGPDDSISQPSRRLSRSISDVGSSAGTNAAAVAAGLTAAVEHLEQVQHIEREEMALRQRRQALQISARLASTNAEQRVYGRDESSRASRRSARSQRNVENERVHVSVDSDAARDERGPDRHH